jgi:hypothetical protein
VLPSGLSGPHRCLQNLEDKSERKGEWTALFDVPPDHHADPPSWPKGAAHLGLGRGPRFGVGGEQPVPPRQRRAPFRRRVGPPHLDITPLILSSAAPAVNQRRATPTSSRPAPTAEGNPDATRPRGQGWVRTGKHRSRREDAAVVSREQRRSALANEARWAGSSNSSPTSSPDCPAARWT